MSACGQCIYWSPHKYIKNHGTCMAEVPFWVDLAAVDNITSKWNGGMCITFREEQEPDIYDLQRELDNCRDQYYLYKDIVEKP